MSFNNIRNFFGNLVPSIPSTIPSEQIKVETPSIALDKVLKEVENGSTFVNARQFAHRLVPAYLEKTDIVGTTTKESLHHWIKIISLWLKDEMSFIPLDISKPQLTHLLTILKEYEKNLSRIQNVGVAECEKGAKEMLEAIRVGIGQFKKGFYVQLGYKGGLYPGHALPVKIIDRGEKVECLFLTLGDGVHMHPVVDWKDSSPLYHFQSFPVLIDKKVLFSDQGIKVFSRLIKLLIEESSADVKAYSAEDVYYPLFSLGTIQSSFDSKIADRASKPQLGDICADMAVVLLIKDVLIDLGVKKENLQRFFCLEKLCDILLFHKHVQKYTPRNGDNWILLKNGIQEFSVRSLKVCGKVLSEQELKFFHDLLSLFFDECQKSISQFHKKNLSSLSIEYLESTPDCLFDYQQLSLEKNENPLHVTNSATKSFSGAITPVVQPISDPKKVLEILADWSDFASNLRLQNQSQKACEFVYKIMLNLPVPGLEKDFWDQVPEEQISDILKALSLLAACGVYASNKNKLAYRNILILSTGLAITDKLARRKWGTYLKDFATPFVASSLEVEHRPSSLGEWFGSTTVKNKPMGSYFKFELLYFKNLSSHWVEIVNYFEKSIQKKKYTLFAIGESVDLSQGVYELRSGYSLQKVSPVKEHLSFLEQFLEKSFPKNSPLSLEEKFAQLWVNKNCEYIPKDIEILNFFAHYCSVAVRFQVYEIPKPILVKEAFYKNGSHHITFPVPESEYQSFPYVQDDGQGRLGLGQNFYSRLVRECTENEIFCQSFELNEYFETKKLVQELRCIFVNPSIQITSLMQWTRSNFAKLVHKEIQNYIEFALFEPGLLAKKIEQEPSTLPQLRGLIKDAIQFYSHSSSNFKIVLFLVRLGICVETYDASHSLDIFSYYESFLIKSLENEQSHKTLIYNHLLFLYKVALPNNSHSLREMLKAQFWVAFHEKDKQLPKWFEMESELSLQLYSDKILFSCRDKEWAEKTFSEIFSLVLPQETMPKDPCESSHAILKKGEYRLDLEKRQIFRGSSQLVYVKKSYRALFSNFSDTGLAWETNGVFYAISGQAKIETQPLKEEQSLVFAIRFPILEELGKEWFYKSQTAPTLFGKCHLADTETYDHWMKPGYIVISKKQHVTPLYLAVKTEKGMKVHKVLPNGKLGAVLINVYNKNESLAAWFHRFGNIKEVCLWFNEEKGRIEEMEFLFLSLSFSGEMVDKKWRFRCREFPEFFVAEEQSLPEVDYFSGALVLENEKGKNLIIPWREFKRVDNDFSTHVSLGPQFHSKSENFFFYSIDEITGELMAEEPAANFFLALLFAEKRNYPLAMRYLSKAKSFNYIYKNNSALIDSFYNLKDHSPEALAFYLRLGILIIENVKQLISDGFNPMKKEGIPDSFFLWMGKILNQYVRIRSFKEISRVPAYIRLTLEEEAFLITVLKPILTKSDDNALPHLIGGFASLSSESYLKALVPNPNWKEIFNVRRELITKGTKTSILYPTSYYLFPPNVDSINWVEDTWVYRSGPAFSKREPINHFVRLSDTDVRVQFQNLYEKAQSQDAHLDIFFLQRSAKGNSFVHFIYGQILRYVQKNPHEFKDLKFGDNLEANKKVFQEIVEKTKTKVLAFKEYISFIKAIFHDHTVFFQYQKMSTLTLPPIPSFAEMKWDFKEEKQIFPILQKELSTHFTIHFLETSEAALFDSKTPFAFEHVKPKTSSEKKIRDDLSQGHKKLLDPKFGKAHYQLKTGVGVEIVLLEAEKLLEAKKQKIHDIREKAEKLANHYSEISFRLGLRKIGKDLPEITMEGILTKAYQTKDLLLIKKANPALSLKEIRELISLTIQYHLFRIQVFQLEKGIHFLEKEKNVQLFGESLFSDGEFNPVDEPEIFLYQSRTGKALRKSQADLFTWEVNSTKELPRLRLFSMTAGEGKTTVYQPIAMKRLNRMGYLPISISPKSLYAVDRDGLAHSSLKAFSFEQAVCELALNTVTRASDFQWIYAELSSYQSEKGLKLTPETFYALHLKYQLALDQEDRETVKWISLIMNLLEERGVAFIDECRLNCSPFTQAKIGIGKPVPLPEVDIRTMLEIYKALVNPKIALKGGSNVKETVCLEENFQATMGKEERRLVKEAVLSFLSDQPFFELASDQKEEVCSWWLGGKKEPAWLEKFAHSEKGRKVKLVRAYFEKCFKAAMNLVWRMQHVKSIKAGEEIHVPAHARLATKAYFEEVYLTLCASIQGVLQEGLTEEQAIKLFCELETKAHLESSSSKVSETEVQFRKWTNLPEFSLADFSYSKHSTMIRFHQIVRKNSDAIFWYLENIVLKQIVFSSEQISVTPVHFLHAFKSLSLFSADFGPEEIYGIYEKGPPIGQKSPFIAHAIHRFLDSDNQQFLTFPPFERPLQFFQFLIQQDPQIFSHLGMICDAGGMLRFTADEMIGDFFEFVKLEKGGDFDGIVIFEESSTEEKETELLIQLKSWQEPKKIKGHDVPDALRSMGLDWKKLKLLTFIDPSHRTGANIEQPKGTSLLLLIGEEQTLSQAAQGGLRGRGVLKKEQKVIWGISKKLAKRIVKNKNEEISLQKSLEWKLTNEGKMHDKEIQLSAYQHIEYAISKPIWQEMKKNKLNPDAQIAIWKKYRKGFVKKVDADLISRFMDSIEANLEKALWEHAEKYYNSFGFSVPWVKADSVHQAIRPILENIRKKNIQAPTDRSIDSLRHTFMHTHQKKEIKQELVMTKWEAVRATPPMPVPSWLLIDEEDFVESYRDQCRAANEVFGSKFLTRGLFLTANAIQTASSGNVHLQEKYLKPLQYVLVIKKKETFSAFVLSVTEAEVFQNQLIHFKTDYPIALLGRDGSLVQNGKNGFSEKELNHSFVEDILIDMGLMRCEMVNPLRFLKRVENWSDFWPMWEKMKQGQPLPQEMSFQAIEKLIPQHLKKDIEEETKKNKPFFGFFKS